MDGASDLKATEQSLTKSKAADRLAAIGTGRAGRHHKEADRGRGEAVRNPLAVGAGKAQADGAAGDGGDEGANPLAGMSLADVFRPVDQTSDQAMHPKTNPLFATSGTRSQKSNSAPSADERLGGETSGGAAE